MEFNMNYSGKSVMDKNKKIHAAAGEYLAEMAQIEKANQEKLNEDSMNSLMHNARLSNASSYMRNKERAKRLQESLTYRDRTTKNAMTEYICSIVENALLIDKDEYALLNPNYKTETRELVYSFLENADINENIRNTDTLTLIEHISRQMPQVNTGILLEDSDVTGIITKAENQKVDDSIANLANNISGKVADLVSKEQEEKQAIQKDLDKIVSLGEAAKAKVAKKDSKDEEPIEDEHIDSAAEEIIEEPEVEEIPEGSVMDEPMDVPAPRRETSVEISPDGKVKIKMINESAIVTEIPKNGLLETLAVNEGMKMIQEGKEYNGDLALANAINYITALEAFNEMGLLSVDNNKKEEIVRLGGGIMLDSRKKK